jgi:prophage DNA circulation protein
MKKGIVILALTWAMVGAAGASQTTMLGGKTAEAIDKGGEKAEGALNMGAQKATRGMQKGDSAIDAAIKTGANQLQQAVGALSEIENTMDKNVELTKQQAAQLKTVCGAVQNDVIELGAEAKKTFTSLRCKGRGLKDRIKKHIH